jgi:hypothetical protein
MSLVWQDLKKSLSALEATASNFGIRVFHESKVRANYIFKTARCPGKRF